MLVTERDCWSLFPRETGMGTIPSHGALCSTGLSTCVRTWMSFQTQKENQNYNKEMEERKELSKNVNGRKER